MWMKYRNHKPRAKGRNFDVYISVGIIVLDTVRVFETAKVGIHDALSVHVLSVKIFFQCFILCALLHVLLIYFYIFFYIFTIVDSNRTQLL